MDRTAVRFACVGAHRAPGQGAPARPDAHHFPGSWRGGFHGPQGPIGKKRFHGEMLTGQHLGNDRQRFRLSTGVQRCEHIIENGLFTAR